MSYTEGPNINRRAMADPDRSNTGLWIAGLVAVCIVVGLIAFATTRSSDTAMSNNAPAVSTRAPAETTGSGAVTSGTVTPAQPAKPLPNANAPGAPAKP